MAGERIPTGAYPLGFQNDDGTGGKAYSQAVDLAGGAGALGTASNPLVTTGGTGTSSNQVQGNIASGVTDGTSMPVKTGGRYNISAPSLIGGQRGDTQMDSRANTKITIVDFGGSAGASVAVPADATANTFNGMRAIALNGVFDGTNWNMARGDTTGAYVVNKGSGSLATNQQSVAATAGGTLIVAARTGRSSVTIFQLGSTQVWLGVNGVTTTTGVPLIGTAGTAVTIPTSAAVYGIVATGSQTVAYLETF